MANVPISTTILLMEIGGFHFGIPAFIGSMVGYAVGHRDVIYDFSCAEQKRFQEHQQWRTQDANLSEQ
jgi:chloride channel protein, CIC family